MLAAEAEQREQGEDAEHHQPLLIKSFDLPVAAAVCLVVERSGVGEAELELVVVVPIVLLFSIVLPLPLQLDAQSPIETGRQASWAQSGFHSTRGSTLRLTTEQRSAGKRTTATT
jgi:hypothetical protein